MSTLVFLHAHPDDESISTGGTIARAVAEGHRVVLVVGTHGDHGETPADLAAGETLVDRRRAETEESCAVLERVERLDPAALMEPREIQRFQTTVLGAIYHAVEHFSMHTGQIILLAKMQTGRDAGFYRLRADGTPEQTWTATRPFE